MALCNKLGNILRQSAAQNKKLPSSMLNYVRCMSSSRLFVGGLSYGVNDQSLKDAFSSYGDVLESRVVTDRDTGRSRGFGFVNFSSNESASSALSAIDGQEINGRSVRVTYANDKPSGPRTGGGGYMRDGGFGNPTYQVILPSAYVLGVIVVILIFQVVNWVLVKFYDFSEVLSRSVRSIWRMSFNFTVLYIRFSLLSVSLHYCAVLMSGYHALINCGDEGNFLK